MMSGSNYYDGVVVQCGDGPVTDVVTEKKA